MELLHKELSYKVQGILMEVRKIYGNGHKEIVYNNGIEELLQRDKTEHLREKSINIYSPITGKKIGTYKPDFIIANLIILESKAVDKIPRHFIDQLYSYLKVSEYELGIFVNFGGPKLYIKRIIFTNDRKHESIRKIIKP